jgi:hypothetical protein
MRDADRQTTQRILQGIARLFWTARYRIYNRDLYAPLRAGRGTKENPLTMSDLEPVMRAVNRIAKSGSRL